MRDSKFTTNDELLNSRPTRETHWILHINEYNFESFGPPSPKKSTN